MLLGRKSESERVPAAPRRPLCSRVAAAGARCSAGERRVPRAAGGPGSRRTSRRGPAERRVSTADRRGVGRRGKHLCRRWLRQRQDRQVRQARQVHQVLGIERGPIQASSTRRTGSRSMRKATCMSPTAGIREFRSSMATGTFKTTDRQRGKSRGDLHHAWSASIPLQLKFKSAGRYRRGRRDL